MKSLEESHADPIDLLIVVAKVCDRLSIPYFVTGSVASMAYGELRYTQDVDLVLELELNQASEFCAQFPEPDFYCWLPSAQDAIKRRSMFNLVHHASGFKVDLIVSDGGEFNRSRFTRRQMRDIQGYEVAYSSPEDVIIKKLDFHRKSGSEKHLRDICSMLKAKKVGVDLIYIDHWTQTFGTYDIWQHVLEKSRSCPEGNV